MAGLPAAGMISPKRLGQDRKSTRLNSSHGYISYAAFCLKKKKDKREFSLTRSGRRAPRLPRPAPRRGAERGQGSDHIQLEYTEVVWLDAEQYFGRLVTEGRVVYETPVRLTRH